MERKKLKPNVSKIAATRRDFLRFAGAGAAGMALGVAAGRYAWIPSPPPATMVRTETVTRTVAEIATETLSYPSSLRAAAEAGGLLIGSFADETSLKDDLFRSTLTREFNCLTASISWGQIHGEDYEDPDTIVKFASEHQMKVTGHALISRLDVPAWVSPQISTSELQQAMRKYIHDDVAHYRGKVHRWIVVNEAVDDEGLRKTIILEKLGEDYIAEAFRLAHEADPSALLFYNDYDAEAAGGYQKVKSDRVYELVKKLVKDGVPIHGVGLQMHLFVVEYPKPEDIAANVRRLAALGLKVSITEMDVRVKDVPLDMNERLEMQRRVYHDVIAACIKEEGFMGVTFWGFTDAHSWINDVGQGPDYPLLFDENYQPKPAYWGVMDALLGR